MQERGVSKHVEVTVDDIGKDGKIADSVYKKVAKNELPVIETVSTPTTATHV
jgi:hypothetical protein